MKSKIAILTVVMIFCVGTIIFFFQRLQKVMENQIAEQVANAQVLLVKAAEGQVRQIFKMAKEELLAVAYSFPLQNLLAAFEKNDEKKIDLWISAVTHRFVGSAETNAFVRQLRFIDSSGQEIVRIDRKKDGNLFPAKVLQNKSKEFYFSKAMSMESNQLYLSPITLNREFGKIEIPHREVIRLATPVTHNRKKKGIVIMNIEMNTIYNIIDNLSEHAWLFDSSGKLLNCSLGLSQEYHDKAIKMIFQQKESRSHLPLDYYHEGGDRSLVGYLPVKVDNQQWYIGSELPFDEISDIMSKSNRTRVTLFAIILIFIISFLIYFYKLYTDRQRVELKAEMAEGLLKLNKQLENKSNELESANRSLEEIDKKKTDFLNMVAHDLRTPLTSIRSYSDLLLRYGDQSDKGQGEYAGIIKKESVRLSSLIDSFLDISKIEAGLSEYNREEIQIKEIIDHFVKVFQGDAGNHQISINSQVEKELPCIYGDKERLGQVLSNLLSNAVKFTPPKGSINVNASLTTINNENNTQVPHIKVSIADTGIGIPQESLDKIFEKFVQLNYRSVKSERGSGLGLAISKDIIEQHGGRIRVESEVGKGATFIFTLKVAEKKSAISN
ncbi:MAG TPA: sensor histidine kinase [Nitrospinota bacterium]|jgi:signal transduction histidine kinase|nr:sensor histidine kinase [Nitrospinota bacterium]